MSNGHGSSRRQAYGRRMKDLRKRRASDLDVDLDGPSTWNRGAEWDESDALHRPRLSVDDGGTSARTR
jgi:hypothetical protein